MNLKNKHYTQKQYEDLFQQLHVSIYDGVRMLKSLNKVVLEIDEAVSTIGPVETSKVVNGELNENGEYVRKETPIYKTHNVTLPRFRDVFVYTMSRFLHAWNEKKRLVGLNDLTHLNHDKTLLDSVLVGDSVTIKHLSSLQIYFPYVEQELWGRFIDYLSCVIKGVFQTSRRIAGLDVSGRYEKSRVIYHTFGMCMPGKTPTMKTRIILVNEEEADNLTDALGVFRPSNFWELD